MNIFYIEGFCGKLQKRNTDLPKLLTFTSQYTFFESTIFYMNNDKQVDKYFCDENVAIQHQK